MVFKSATALAAFTLVAVVLSIIVVIFAKSFPAIEHFGFFHFLTSSDWVPNQNAFGALSSLYGTVLTAVLSLTLSVPVAIGIAIFTTEIAPPFLREIIRSSIEMLASIPSIIYGMWGFFTLSSLMGEHVEPWLQQLTLNIPFLSSLFAGPTRGIDILTASVILSVMILPFTASTARDGFELTPNALKEAAYSMGSTKWEVIRKVILPYARNAIVAGSLLSLGRALGETMAVSFVLGNTHRISTSLLEGASTITVTLANEFSEADGELYTSSLYLLAFFLFCMSFLIHALAKYFLMRKDSGN